jgi:hypothetical protein
MADGIIYERPAYLHTWWRIVGHGIHGLHGVIPVEDGKVRIGDTVEPFPPDNRLIRVE